MVAHFTSAAQLAEMADETFIFQSR